MLQRKYLQNIFKFPQNNGNNILKNRNYAGGSIKTNSYQIFQKVFQNASLISIFHKTTNVISKQNTGLDLLKPMQKPKVLTLKNL